MLLRYFSRKQLTIPYYYIELYSIIILCYFLLYDCWLLLLSQGERCLPVYTTQPSSKNNDDKSNNNNKLFQSLSLSAILVLSAAIAAIAEAGAIQDSFAITDASQATITYI